MNPSIALVSFLSVTLCVVAWSPQEDASIKVAASFPNELSATGFFKDVVTHELAEGFVPYSVAAPAWADGAVKDRFLRLPPGSKIDAADPDRWRFPVGTIFLQTIRFATADSGGRVETRVIRVEEEEKLAFATYLWSPAQDAASLVTKGRSLYVDTGTGRQLWKVTATDRCDECHVKSIQPILGVHARQLHLAKDGVSTMDDLRRRGLFEGAVVPAAEIAQLCDPMDVARSLDDRARSYLDVNCSICHRPGGNGSGAMDLRKSTPRENSGLGPKKEIVVDGQPFRSWIYLRMIYENRQHMPTLLVHQVDEEGARLIRDWVESLGADPGTERRPDDH